MGDINMTMLNVTGKRRVLHYIELSRKSLASSEKVIFLVRMIDDSSWSKIRLIIPDVNTGCFRIG
jgi:hypothetical protein